jgi:hypothetical protein
MDAKGDTHYRGNAVLVPTFLALYFFFFLFLHLFVRRKRGVTVLSPFFF